MQAVRPSEILASIDTPQEVVQHCLVCSRKADISGFAKHLSEDALRRPQSVHWIAGVKAAEGGPLLQCAGKYPIQCNGDNSHPGELLFCCKSV